MLFKNHSPFVFGYKVTSRQPPGHELCAFVRAKFEIRPDQKLTLARSRAVEGDTIDVLAEEQTEYTDEVDKALLVLGQGSLQDDQFADGDDRRVGEVIYPSDFADFKLNAEVMLRAACYPGRNVAQSSVQVDVGTWSKSLHVMGIRVWTDRLAGGEKTEAQPFMRMPIDYAHSYGGPGFAHNPVGKGHLDEKDAEPSVEQDEELYVPPRSERSMLMASNQVANIRHQSGAELKNNLPAGFGPINPNWPQRTSKLGKKYDEEWRATRAPYFAEDFDWTYFNQAPPDQQLDGYLKGDEKLRFQNLHPDSTDFSAQLPGRRVRLFVLDDDDKCREVPMNLDTLFIDLEEGALYLTWRGLTSAKQPDLADVKFGYIVDEDLDTDRVPAREYEESLRAFAADPVGMNEAMPEGFTEAAALLEELDGEEKNLEELLEKSDDSNPVVGLLNQLGPVATPVTNAVKQPLDTALGGLDGADLKKTVSAALAKGQSPGPTGQAAATKQLSALQQTLTKQETLFGRSPKLDEAFAKVANASDGEPDDSTTDDTLPGPGANLKGSDLSDRDLSGLDLTGADLSQTILEGTNLQGATLRDALLTGAQLTKTNLSGADLTGADLREVVAQKATLAGATLDEASLERGYWNKSEFSDASMQRANAEMLGLTECTLCRINARETSWTRANIETSQLDGADLSGGTFKATSFRECEALELSLKDGQLDGASFHKCQLESANFSRAKGERCAFSLTTLTGAYFDEAQLVMCNFSEASSAKASFRSAVLSLSRFDKADLTRASFFGACLKSACLIRAQLDKADFSEATLYETDLSETRGEQCVWTGAKMTRVHLERTRVHKS